MNNILKELQETINSLPKNPMAGKVVLIPAGTVEREEKQIDENGKEITVKKVLLYPLPQFNEVWRECVRANVEYILNEFVPTMDADGKPCIFIMDKPQTNIGFGRLLDL